MNSETYKTSFDTSNLGFEGIKEILQSAIKDLNEKNSFLKIRDKKKEELRIKSLRTIAYLCKTYSNILKALKVEEIEAKMEILKKLMGADNNDKDNK